MEIMDNIDPILKKISFDTKAVFVGLYKDEKPLRVYSSLGEKENVISELTGILVRKALISSSELMEDFIPEFLFAEGKDYGIYIYIVQDNIVIATIVNEKPNFSLLKITHESAAKEIMPNIKKAEKSGEKVEGRKEEKTVKEEVEAVSETLEKAKEEKIEETPKISEKEEGKQTTQEVAEEFEELEKALSGQLETEEQEPEEKVEEKKEEIKEEEVKELPEVQEEVPLEEILGVKEKQPVEAKVSEETSNIDELLEEIKKEFIKEVGPVGKIIFNKTLKSVSLEKNPSTGKLKELVDKLSDEIPVEIRRVKFIQHTKKIIGG